MEDTKKIKRKSVTYDRWGYFFIAPFFIAFIIFSLIPLVSTIGNSFFENYRIGLSQVGPKFNGIANYVSVLTNGIESNENGLPDFINYAWNTLVMWVLGFIPQIVIALILSILFTDNELNLKFKQFFKTVVYMPNLIMASAFAMLFFVLFSNEGPVNSILCSAGVIPDLQHPIKFMIDKDTVRSLVGTMNFLMWYGNTTLLLMSGIMGINESIFEAARIDGANPVQVFFSITLPSLRPILVYVIITSLIGGLQMFDVPQILTNGQGNPNRSAMTMIMFLNNHLASKNFGMAGAVSVIIFFVTGVFSAFVYKYSMRNYKGER